MVLTLILFMAALVMNRMFVSEAQADRRARKERK